MFMSAAVWCSIPLIGSYQLPHPQERSNMEESVRIERCDGSLISGILHSCSIWCQLDICRSPGLFTLLEFDGLTDGMIWQMEMVTFEAVKMRWQFQNLGRTGFAPEPVNCILSCLRPHKGFLKVCSTFWKDAFSMLSWRYLTWFFFVIETLGHVSQLKAKHVKQIGWVFG